MSNVKVIVGKFPPYCFDGFTHCTEHPNDTIEVKTDGELPIIIKECEVKIEFPSPHIENKGFIYND